LSLAIAVDPSGTGIAKELLEAVGIPESAEWTMTGVSPSAMRSRNTAAIFSNSERTKTLGAPKLEDDKSRSGCERSDDAHRDLAGG